MATPTPSVNAPKPGPQNAATPTSHPHLAAFSSPAPRSVPSPATQRTQAGKSPFTTTTAAGANLMATHNPPTGGSASGLGKLLGSSPAAAVLGLESPAAMLYSMSNISGLDGSLPMGLSMSGLGGGSSMRGIADDEERRRRLEEVVKKLRKPTPRISIEGLETLAKRANLDTTLEMDKRQETTTVLMAGTSLLVDVRFDRRNMVENVEVQFPTSSDLVNEQAQAASKLLHRDLSVENETDLLTMNLDKFARNLDYLGSMDRLSGPIDAPNFNCFEAISGVYKSLRKLFEHEKAAAKLIIDSKLGNRDQRAEREVLCKKSGRPGIHQNGKVGLRLDYWMNQRHVFRNSSKSENGFKGDVMDVDEAVLDGEDDDLFSLLIECEEIKQPALEIPARISDTWLADPVERPLSDANAAFGLAADINWDDPPPTYLKDPNQTEGAIVDDSTLGKLPNVRFIAKFDPPLVVQYAYQPTATGANVYDQFAGPTKTFAGQLLKPNLQEDLVATLTNSLQEFSYSERWVMTDEDDVLHKNTLWVSKPDWAKVLEEIPFSHPQELIQALPKLRQYAFINGLIRSTFADLPVQSSKTGCDSSSSALRRCVDIDFCAPLEPKPRLLVNFGTINKASVSTINGAHNDSTLEDLLDDILGADSNAEDSAQDANANRTSALSSVSFDVLPNADIVVVEESDKPKEVAERLAKALDVCGDIGVWVEWIGRKT